jgi:hypothetical protein
MPLVVVLRFLAAVRPFGDGFVEYALHVGEPIFTPLLRQGPFRRPAGESLARW